MASDVGSGKGRGSGAGNGSGEGVGQDDPVAIHAATTVSTHAHVVSRLGSQTREGVGGGSDIDRSRPAVSILHSVGHLPSFVRGSPSEGSAVSSHRTVGNGEGDGSGAGGTLIDGHVVD